MNEPVSSYHRKYCHRLHCNQPSNATNRCVLYYSKHVIFMIGHHFRQGSTSFNKKEIFKKKPNWKSKITHYNYILAYGGRSRNNYADGPISAIDEVTHALTYDQSQTKINRIICQRFTYKSNSITNDNQRALPYDTLRNVRANRSLLFMVVTGVKYPSGAYFVGADAWSGTGRGGETESRNHYLLTSRSESQEWKCQDKYAPHTLRCHWKKQNLLHMPVTPFFLSLDLCLPTHCRCRGYCCPWSHSMTYTYLVGLLWTRDRLVLETSTWQHNNYKRQTSIPPAGFEPAIPAASDRRPTL
jgi:hypothetical protein